MGFHVETDLLEATTCHTVVCYQEKMTPEKAIQLLSFSNLIPPDSERVREQERGRDTEGQRGTEGKRVRRQKVGGGRKGERERERETEPERASVFSSHTSN